MTAASFDEIIAKDGEWTAMSIKLSNGEYTRRPPKADYRLKRLVQIAQDTMRKPISECRVLDLACLEGHYAIEFALHGAETVGIEGRAVSVTKCDFVKNDLGLKRTTFFQDDVRNLSRERYGCFDIVICSGILYHLRAEDIVRFLQSIAEVCNGILLIDTFIALSSQTTETVAGEILHGLHNSEHFDHDDKITRLSRLLSSLDNTTSFWMTEPTLINLLSKVGFTSILDVLVPTMPAQNLPYRKTYLAVRGQPAIIKSSDLSNNVPLHRIPEGRGMLFNLVKAALPQPIKNAIKPVLRGLKILPPAGGHESG